MDTLRQVQSRPGSRRGGFFVVMHEVEWLRLELAITVG
jgi:hypothetical protein